MIVLGQIVQNYNENSLIPDILRNANGGLSFVELTSIATVVQNPHDPPNMWLTSPLVLNFSSTQSDRFRWYVCLEQI